MREIKFRGKRLDNGEWITGHSIVQFDDSVYISDFDGVMLKKTELHHLFREVDSVTVGQYTGLNDKNGTMAYAGDIFEDHKGSIRTIFQVPGGFACEANPKSFGFHNPATYTPIIGLSDEQNASWFSDTCTILGNIHDNPELLKLDEE